MGAAVGLVLLLAAGLSAIAHATGLERSARPPFIMFGLPAVASPCCRHSGVQGADASPTHDHKLGADVDGCASRKSSILLARMISSTFMRVNVKCAQHCADARELGDG